MRTRMKICCIRDMAEAYLAVSYGVDAIGLVGPMPNGPGQIDAPTVRAITAGAPAGVSSWTLTIATDAATIIETARASATQTIQLVCGVEPEVADAVRAALPALRVVSVVHVDGAAAIDAAVRIAAHVHGLVLDSGQPGASKPTYGGTGDTHDWHVSRRIVDAVDGPVWLAGGLSPENIGDAIRAVRPFGVDVCSKLRTAGVLDAAKVAAFSAAVRAADGQGGPRATHRMYSSSSHMPRLQFGDERHPDSGD